MEKKVGKRIPPEKERVLNPIVERHRLCGPKSVGQVSELILAKPFQNKEDWARFYHDSGKEREKIIEEESKRLKKTELKKRISSLSTTYGRTEKELDEKAKKLFGWIPDEKTRLKNSLIQLDNITLEDCEKCMKQYVIDNTWEGIIRREEAVVQRLKKKGFKNIEKTEGDIDTKKGVDREIFSDDRKKKVGLQIKPASSRGSALIDDHNKAAQSKYDGKVITIFANTKGKIKDEDRIINEIKEELDIS